MSTLLVVEPRCMLSVLYYQKNAAALASAHHSAPSPHTPTQPSTAPPPIGIHLCQWAILKEKLQERIDFSFRALQPAVDWLCVKKV